MEEAETKIYGSVRDFMWTQAETTKNMYFSQLRELGAEAAEPIMAELASLHPLMSSTTAEKGDMLAGILIGLHKNGVREIGAKLHAKIEAALVEYDAKRTKWSGKKFTQELGLYKKGARESAQLRLEYPGPIGICICTLVDPKADLRQIDKAETFLIYYGELSLRFLIKARTDPRLSKTQTNADYFNPYSRVLYKIATGNSQVGQRGLRAIYNVLLEENKKGGRWSLDLIPLSNRPRKNRIVRGQKLDRSWKRARSGGQAYSKPLRGGLTQGEKRMLLKGTSQQQEIAKKKVVRRIASRRA